MLFPLLHCKRDLPQSPAVCLLGLNGTFARLSAMSASGLGFNRSMQHTKTGFGGRSVCNGTAAADLLFGKPEGADVGALAEG